MGKATTIKADDVIVSRRGRKPVIDADLVADLNVLVKNPTKVLDFAPHFVGLDLSDLKARQKASAKLRKHWVNHLGKDGKSLRLDFAAGRIQAQIRPSAPAEVDAETVSAP